MSKRIWKRIIFNVPEAYDFLIENGEVYTIREAKGNYIKKGKHQVLSNLFHRIVTYKRILPSYVGLVNVELEKALIAKPQKTEQELKPYVAKSGFKEIPEWLSKVKDFKEGKIYHLYHVTEISFDFP